MPQHDFYTIYSVIHFRLSFFLSLLLCLVIAQETINKGLLHPCPPPLDGQGTGENLTPESVYNSSMSEQCWYDPTETARAPGDLCNTSLHRGNVRMQSDEGEMY